MVSLKQITIIKRVHCIHMLQLFLIRKPCSKNESGNVCLETMDVSNSLKPVTVIYCNQLIVKVLGIIILYVVTGYMQIIFSYVCSKTQMQITTHI